MNDIFSYYTTYRKHTGKYNNWRQDINNKDKHPDNISVDKEKLKGHAKTIAEPLLLLDKYEHEKAEDAETFFQTYNIELMSITSLLCSLPVAVTKLSPFLSKHANKHSLIKTTSELLNKYKDKTINIASKNIPLSKALTVASSVVGGLFFANGIKHSMQSQLGLIRKAGFDGTQGIINDAKLFTVLNPKQEKEVQRIVNYQGNRKNDFVDKLKDKVNLSSSFQSVGDFKRNNTAYLNQKSEYNRQLEEVNKKPVPSANIEQAKEQKILFENLIKNVEHDVLDPLERVEKAANITYSAMFTGGFLEYLISDKLVDVLGIKNKPVRTAMKIGVPLLTYFILNKNISDIENKAILATKYKHLKEFTENPEQYASESRNNKQPFFKFLKTVRKDMKDYEKFSENELPQIEAKLMAKKDISYTPAQMQEAKLMQKNTSMVINNLRENVYNQSVGIKSLSETILGPLDVVATAVGGFIGNRLSKKFPDSKISGLMTGLGAIAAFIPAAIVEAKLTGQQKLSEKSAVMLTLQDMQDISKFADKEKFKIDIPQMQKTEANSPEIFKNFSKN